MQPRCLPNMTAQSPLPHFSAGRLLPSDLGWNSQHTVDVMQLRTFGGVGRCNAGLTAQKASAVAAYTAATAAARLASCWGVAAAAAEAASVLHVVTESTQYCTAQSSSHQGTCMHGRHACCSHAVKQHNLQLHWRRRQSARASLTAVHPEGSACRSAPFVTSFVWRYQCQLSRSSSSVAADNRASNAPTAMQTGVALATLMTCQQAVLVEGRTSIQNLRSTCMLTQCLYAGRWSKVVS
jgi:hypothetical protein